MGLEKSALQTWEMGVRGICPFLGVFKLIPVNFPGLVASSHAKDPVLIQAIKTLLLMLLHQIKDS